MFCSQCGSKLVENAKFCSECGSPVKRASRIETAGDAAGTERVRAFPEFVFPEEENEPPMPESAAADPEAIAEVGETTADAAVWGRAEAAEDGEQAPKTKPEVSDRYVPEFEAVWEVPDKPAGWAAENPVDGQDVSESGAAETKKPKKKRTLLIAALAVLLFAGGIFACFALMGDGSDKGVFSIFDLNKDEKKLDKEQEEIFLELISRWDAACQKESVYQFSRAFPEYAHSYIVESYNLSSVEGLLAWMHYLSFGRCGDDSVFTEAYEVERRIEDTARLAHAIENVTGHLTFMYIAEAYLIRNTTTVEGSKDRLLLTDLYLFYKVEDSWYLILVKDPADFDL